VSQSRFVVGADGTVSAALVFAKPDALALGHIDRNHDGEVSPGELQASVPVFAALVRRGVLVTADDAPCASRLLEGDDVGGDGYGLSAAFACARGAQTIDVGLPLLDELPRGHEHLLRIEAGSAVVEKVLSGADRSAELRVPSTQSAGERFTTASLSAVKLGMRHILGGWDHLLFLAALFLGTRALRDVVLSITAFTVAHSITLALAALGVYAPSPRFVEPAIAASIAFVAFENALRPAPTHRWRIAFLFGLVHGFGFAGALEELALSRARRVPTLLGFNLGVELGQIGVIATAVPLLAWLRRRASFEPFWIRAISAVIGLVGATLCLRRMLAPG
jgi:hydrogenase/urease accessory protein HupE